MRTTPLALLLVAACVVRDAGLDDYSTGSADSAPTTGELDNPAGFCAPINVPEDCLAGYLCCSDDPATTQGRLPNYFTGKIDDRYGQPIFSGANNSLSYSGQCVDVGDFASPFDNGCPVPCNPTWNVMQRDSICGPGTQCCPFQQLDPIKDCVIDENTKLWRAVRGADIPALSKWGPQHTTNQDPVGSSCMQFASSGGAVDKDVLSDCFYQLNVADQRGFCYQTCPCYEDLCAMKNPGWTPRC